MAIKIGAIDPALLTTFALVEASSHSEPDGTSRVSEQVAESSRFYRYRLRDRALWHKRFDRPIFSLATRSAGSIVASHADSRFATEVLVDGDQGSLFCFTTLLHGHMTLIHNGKPTTGTEATGLVWRPGPGTDLLISDRNARTNIFFKVAEVEDALEHLLDDRLRKPLDFRPNLDWNSGLTTSLKYQLDFVMHEFRRSDGVANNPVALASITDLLVSLVLRGAPHNYRERLSDDRARAVPIYIKRAEDFMRANSKEPIRIVQVAAAAGCSVRTLGTVFRHFRCTTPLGALHAIRLEHAHGELILGASSGSVATVAHRYGFTNATRFNVAFRRRFGMTPLEAVQRASRS